MASSLTVIIVFLSLKWCQSAGCTSGPFCPKASALEANSNSCTAPDPPRFSPSVKELKPDEKYEITVTYQVPEKSGCLYLTKLNILYRLKDQNEWKTVAVDLSRNTMNIKYIGTGSYMIMMRATNDQGITSESEVKAIEVGKEKDADSYTTVYIIAAAVGMPLLVATIVGIVVAVKRRRRSKKRAARSKALASVPVILVPSAAPASSEPTPLYQAQTAAPRVATAPPASPARRVATSPPASPAARVATAPPASPAARVGTAPPASPAPRVATASPASSAPRVAIIPGMIKYESLLHWVCRLQTRLDIECVPMTARQLGAKVPAPRRKGVHNASGPPSIPDYQGLPKWNPQPDKVVQSSGPPTIPDYQGLPKWNPQPDKVVQSSGPPTIPDYQGLPTWNPQSDKVAQSHQHVAIRKNSPTAIERSTFEVFFRKKKAAIAQQFTDLKRCAKGTTPMVRRDNTKNVDISHKIRPYEHNRVVLHDDGTHADGDYINASYIAGYGGNEKAYIAAQAPTSQTVDQFWRMIWQSNVNRIVMLVKVADQHNVEMSCPRYWPKNKGDTLRYGSYVLTLLDITEYAVAMVRAIQIKKKNESRLVFHFHFNYWDDVSTPVFGPLPLLSLIKMVHEIDTVSKGPLVIHCRTGVGRTGMYIALDILLQQMAVENCVDVFGCVKSLREQRINMIQDETQYIFLYDAILEEMTVEKATYKLWDVCDWITSMTRDDLFESENIAIEFSVLREILSKRIDFSKQGLSSENKSKNRLSNVVPADCDRPYLYTLVPGHTDYINAVFVDSFRRRSQFIVSQMPLPNTQVDFWRLVYDYDIQLIVMLNELDTRDETCQQYWDDHRTMRFGPISVQRTAFDRVSPDIEYREFNVRLAWIQTKPTKTVSVRHYRLLNWPNDKLLPDDNTGFHSLLNVVTNWRKTRAIEENNTVIVHCMNGVARSGMFCAACHCVEQIATNENVDVLLAARFVCARRSQFLQSIEEYVYLYSSLSEYLVPVR